MDPRSMYYALAVVQAYVLGSVPFGYVIVRLTRGIDVRTVGSGNIGATNVARAAGKWMGIIAFLLDVAKGVLAVTVIPFFAYILSGGTAEGQGTFAVLRQSFTDTRYLDLRMACGLAAIVGHVWTMFLGFKGGKGVATSLGVLLGLAPWPTLFALFVWAVVVRISGYVSLGSIAAAVALPVVFAVLAWEKLAGQWRLLAFMVIVSAIVVARHRGNIRRLLDGTENRFSLGRRTRRRTRRR